MSPVDHRAARGERRDNPGMLVLGGIVVMLVAVAMFALPLLFPPADEDLRLSRRVGMLFFFSPVVLLFGLGTVAVGIFQALRRRRDRELTKYEERAVDPF